MNGAAAAPAYHPLIGTATIVASQPASRRSTVARAATERTPMASSTGVPPVEPPPRFGHVSRGDRRQVSHELVPWQHREEDDSHDRGDHDRAPAPLADQGIADLGTQEHADRPGPREHERHADNRRVSVERAVDERREQQPCPGQPRPANDVRGRHRVERDPERHGLRLGEQRERSDHRQRPWRRGEVEPVIGAVPWIGAVEPGQRTDVVDVCVRAQLRGAVCQLVARQDRRPHEDDRHREPANEAPPWIWARHPRAEAQGPRTPAGRAGSSRMPPRRVAMSRPEAWSRPVSAPIRSGTTHGATAASSSAKLPTKTTGEQ